MDEFAPIREYVSRYVKLTPEEEDYFVSLLQIKKVKKKQFVVQPDFICQYRSYVVNGAFRTYLLGNDGEEHTIALAIEDWWVGDLGSYIFQEPATLFIEALEDSTLNRLSYKNEQLLLEQIPKFERFFHAILIRGAVAMQKRMLSSLSKTAEERYDEFEKKYPKFVQRFPQYIIASYLGMTTQFLSKIRNTKANN